MKRTRRHTTTGNPAGRKPENRERSGKSYIVYDSCYNTPLKVYIRVVCDHNLRALVISGNPPEDVLYEAMEKMNGELSELSGSGEYSARKEVTRKVYTYRAMIALLCACQRTVAAGEREKAVKYLLKLGVRCNGDDRKLIEVLSGIIREKKIRLRSEEERFRKLFDGEKEENVTRAYFADQLVALSKYAGFRLTTDIMLSEYASYLKSLKEDVERYKTLMNGNKHK